MVAASPDELRGDAAANWAMWRAVGGSVRIAADADGWRRHRDAILRADVIVDALLGTGLDGPARGLPAHIIRDVRLHHGQASIVAVDLPSGLASDQAGGEGEVLDADITVTFTAPKPCQALQPNAARCGKLRIGAIGTTAAIVEAIPGDRLHAMEAADVKMFAAPRSVDSHKGVYGHVAVIAGSRSKPGAAILAGTAALRSGAGLATVITAKGAAPAIVGKTPELMTIPADELPDGSLGPASFDFDWLARAAVVALGPGLGALPENQALVRRLVAEIEQPLIVDADGLTALAGITAPAARDGWPRRTRTLILTPHPGEMARLTGLSTAEVQADRLGVARKLAVEKNAIVVLKGAGTLIAAPDGSVVINSTGTPAMATAGSGDVLTGVLAGLLAQFPEADPRRVVAAGVWLHGKAGEIAAERWGDRAMLAGDMLETLPGAFRMAQ